MASKIIDVDVEMDGLRGSIKRAAEYLNKSEPEMVKTAAEYFAQSVIKATPQSKSAKRKSVAMTGFHHSKPDFFRTTKKSTDRRYNKTWIDNTQSAAKAHEPIIYRGIGKFAWLNAVNSIGVTPRTGFKPGDRLRRLPPSILGYGAMRKSGEIVFAELSNQAPAIGRYGKIAAKIALKNANNRLRAYVKSETDKLGLRF